MEDFKAFFKKHYLPNNAILTDAGTQKSYYDNIGKIKIKRSSFQRMDRIAKRLLSEHSYAIYLVSP